MNLSSDIIVSRSECYVEKAVIVDGLPGCGKTLFSPIIASLNRVELLTYVYEIEYICSLFYLKKISLDATVSMIRTFTDLRLYNSMMSRDLNFRFKDISSIFNNPNPYKYLMRLFKKGDEIVPQRIASEKPILHLTTHNLLGFSEPICEAMNHRLSFIEIVRHPLSMINQIALNMERILASPRDFSAYFFYRGQQLPYYALGWEEIFLAANPTEKAIYFIDQLTRLTNFKKKLIEKKYDTKILTIPFERFIINPYPFMASIESLLETKSSNRTRKIMKKQKVPRKIYSDGIDLAIYRRCGWTPPQSDSNKHELDLRRELFKSQISDKVLSILDHMCEEYEKSYLINP